MVAGDFFEAVPSGGDVYILSWIIHDWDDDRSITILKNCRRAMADDARLLMVEQVVPPGNEPSLSKLYDLQMLVRGRGPRAPPGRVSGPSRGSRPRGYQDHPHPGSSKRGRGAATVTAVPAPRP